MITVFAAVNFMVKVSYVFLCAAKKRFQNPAYKLTVQRFFFFAYESSCKLLVSLQNVFAVTISPQFSPQPPLPQAYSKQHFLRDLRY